MVSFISGSRRNLTRSPACPQIACWARAAQERPGAAGRWPIRKLSRDDDADRGGAASRILLGGRRSDSRPAGDDRVPPPGPLPPGPLARSAPASDRHSTDRAEARRPPVRQVGSRLPLDYARETGANFLTAAALDAARARTAYVEPRQSLDHQRMWADLLSSAALSFNLFGDLAADLALADRAVHGWFPDAPGRVSEVRFVHSPGWFDPAYINSLRSFDDGVRPRPRRRQPRHRRRRRQVPRAQQTGDPSNREPRPLRRGRRDARRCSLPARSTR